MYIDFDRFDKLVKETRKSKSHLCRCIGKTRYYLRDAKKANMNVPDELVSVLAEELNTTPKYLTGVTDIKEKPPASAREIERQTEELLGKMSLEQLIELIAKATEKIREKNERKEQ